MAGRKQITREAVSGLYLATISMGDSLNAPIDIPFRYVPEMRDVMRSSNVLDGTGEMVDELYRKIVPAYNSSLRSEGSSAHPLVEGGEHAQILKVAYCPVRDGDVNTSGVSLTFTDFVRMGRPYYLMEKVRTVRKIRAVKNLDPKYR